MKNWKTLLLIVGILLLVASFAAYAYQISGCYPPASIWAQYTSEQISGMKQACQFDSSVFVQFKYFLLLFVPGIALFSAYWLITRPIVKIRQIGMLNAFIILIMFDSLLVMCYGLLGYPVPGNAKAPAAWVVEVIAILGFLCYLSTLALWHWKRWGLMLFQGTSVALAVFLLLGGQFLILAAVIVAGVLGLSLLLHPVRNKLV